MNCPHDYENDDCTNCANGLPPFRCLMNDEENKGMFEFMYAKKVKNEELIKLIKENMDTYYISVDFNKNGNVEVFIGNRKESASKNE